MSIFIRKNKLSDKTKKMSSAISLEQKNDKKRVNLTKSNAWLLWCCMCLNISVVALELDSWMIAIILLLLTWQAILLISVHRNINQRKNNQQTKQNPKSEANHQAQLNKPRAAVSPVLLGIFALLGCLAIVITAKQAGVLVSMLHLLCFSYTLKAFELKARSDFYQLLLLGLFVLASSLIFRQDLAFTLIVITFLIVNFAVLLQYFSLKNTVVTDIKVVAILLTQSIVLAVILFLVFPRLSPFWQVPLANSAATGLSDTVKPGDIANLTRSTKLAFRADFGKQKIPTYSQLYWRAMVLENYDGREWTKNSSVNMAGKTQLTHDDFTPYVPDSEVKPLDYQITVAASYQKYLFALAPAVISEQTIIKSKPDYTISSAKVITQAMSYNVSSYLTVPLDIELPESSRKRNLNYPQGSNPRLEEMALTLRHDYQKSKARAQAVLNLIHEQNYAYTLQPPILKNNSLDQFFFDTQAGFCVHYASAFTFLMRASGIPARLVTGYLGGEYNGTTNDGQSLEQSSDKSMTQGHLSIYQYDAHAWSEIWVKGEGWIRIDPTSAVDPERVNLGWSTELLKEQSSLNNQLLSLYQWKHIAWLNSLRLQFDSLDYQWTRWVIGFTAKQQHNLFNDWFGKMSSWKLALIITVSLVISMAMLMLFLHLFNRSKQKKRNFTQWQNIYQNSIKLLAKQGLHKPPAMTVSDFAKMVREQSPELAITFTRLSNDYNALSYQTLTIDEQAKLTLTMQQQFLNFKNLIKKI